MDGFLTIDVLIWDLLIVLVFWLDRNHKLKKSFFIVIHGICFKVVSYTSDHLQSVPES